MEQIDIKSLMERLMPLKERGYIKVSFLIDESGFLDILLIHKDWLEYEFSSQFDQAAKDLEDLLVGSEKMYALEIPTKDMFLKERNPEAPVFTYNVFDIMDVIHE